MVIAKNFINFLKVEASVKLKFLVKLRRDGFTKDSFFRLFLIAYLEDDPLVWQLIQSKKYIALLDDEKLRRKQEEDKRKTELQQKLGKASAFKKMKEYDIIYFFKEDK